MGKSYLISALVTERLNVNEPYGHQHRAADVFNYYHFYVLSWVIKQQFFFISFCYSQHYHPLGDVDDPMHSSPWPSGNSASGHIPHLRGNNFEMLHRKYELLAYYEPTRAESQLRMDCS